VQAELPVRVGSEAGRTEFLMVGLLRTDRGYAPTPWARAPGRHAFSGADGFIRIPAQTSS